MSKLRVSVMARSPEAPYPVRAPTRLEAVVEFDLPRVAAGEPDVVVDREQREWFSPALLVPNANRRVNEAVQCVTALVFEWERKPGFVGALPSLDDVVSFFEGLELWAYTTYRHTPEDGRFRIVFPVDEPIPANEYAAIRRAFRGVFEPDLPGQAEESDVRRIWFLPSVPDTQALKHYRSRYEAGERLKLADLRSLAGAAPVESRVPPRPSRATAPEAPEGSTLRALQATQAALEAPRASIPAIEAGCSFMVHARDHAAAIREPEWRAWLSILSRAVGGREYAHAVGSKYPGYSEEETNGKLDRIEGPYRCDTIAALHPDCATCPFRGKIITPVELGERLSAADGPVGKLVEDATTEAPVRGLLDNAMTFAQIRQRREYLDARVADAEQRVAVAAERLTRAREDVKLRVSIDPGDAIKRREEANRALVEARAEVKRLAKARDAALRPEQQIEITPDLDPNAAANLSYEMNGALSSSLGNAFWAAVGLPEFSGLYYDTFTSRVMVGDEPLEDRHVISLRLRVERMGAQKAPSSADAKAALYYAALLRKRNVFREWTDSLPEWDGTPRCEHLFERGFGAPGEWPRRFSKWWMIGAMGRGLADGKAFKFDYMPILIGLEGKGKSTAIASLLPYHDWFTDTPLPDKTADIAALLASTWIKEWGELANISKKDTDALKAMLSSTQDDVRLPYAPGFVRIYRHTVIIGTSNRRLIGSSLFGDRRYWPVLVSPRSSIDIDWIVSNRDQMWAEARVRLEAGERFYPDPEEQKALAERMQDEFSRSDVMFEVVQGYLEQTKPEYIHVPSFIEQVLLDRNTNRDTASRVESALDALGWTRARSVRPEFHGKRQRHWIPPLGFYGGA